MGHCRRFRGLSEKRVFPMTMYALVLVTAVHSSSVFRRPSPSEGRITFEDETGWTPYSAPSQMLPQLPVDGGGGYIPLPALQHDFPFPLFDPQCVACPYNCGRLGTTRSGRHCCLECAEGYV